MTVYMPPISRKKRVEERYNPDTFRVISSDAEKTHPKFESQSYRASFEPETPVERILPDINCGRTRVLPKPTADFRSHNPHPNSCSFIRTDVRLLNDPICTVFTKETHPQQNRWWPARANEGTLQRGDHTLDTVYRNDYLYTSKAAPQASYRHSANPNTTAARGIAPVNFMKERDGQQGFFKESLSFEHQYDSRVDPNYPIRGKRQGAFVYSKMDAETKQKYIDTYMPAESPPHNGYNPEMSRRGSQPNSTTAAPKTETVPSPSQTKCASPRRQSAASAPKESVNAHSKPDSQRTPQGSEAAAAAPAPGQGASQQQPATAPAKDPSPEMLPTASSPVEIYNPDTDTLKGKPSAST